MLQKCFSPMLHSWLFRDKIIGLFVLFLILNYPSAVARQDEPSPEELASYQKFNALLQLDLECLSPCWWGNELGTAKGQDLYSTFEKQIGEDRFVFSGNLQSDFLLIGLGTANPFRIFVDLEDGVFNQIELSFHHPIDHSIPNEYFDGYSLNELIDAYGMPSKIFVEANWLDQAILIFNDFKMIVHYVWRNSPETLSQTNLLCPDSNWLLGFELFAYDHNADFEERNETFSGIDFGRRFQSIEEATDLTLQDFVSNLAANPNLCVELDSEK
jgi:hypothetical protein